MLFSLTAQRIAYWQWTLLRIANHLVIYFKIWIEDKIPEEKNSVIGARREGNKIILEETKGRKQEL